MFDCPIICFRPSGHCASFRPNFDGFHFLCPLNSINPRIFQRANHFPRQFPCIKYYQIHPKFPIFSYFSATLFSSIWFMFVHVSSRNSAIWLQNISLILFHFNFQLLCFLIGPLNLSPCSSMTPIWWSAIVHVPKYFESLFMPLIHFTLMLERVRATLFMDQYEREGLHFGLISLLTIVLSFPHFTFINLH